MPSIFLKNSVAYPTYQNLFSISNLDINNDEQVKSNYVYFSENIINESNTYCNSYGISSNPNKLLDKSKSNQLFLKYGFKSTTSIVPLQRSDVENLDDTVRLIIKPSKSFSMLTFDRSPISQVSYKPLTKAALLEIIDYDTEFWNRQQSDNPSVIQNYIEHVDSGNKQDFLILYGAINGSGGCYNANPAVSSRSYNNRRFNSLNVWSSENINDQITSCQTKINNLLQGEEIRNVFYNFQLLYDGEDYIPLDIQYRLGYNELALWRQLQDTTYINDLVNFTYDISTNLPQQPYTTCMKLSEGRMGGHITTGTTKAEALDTMNNV